jgi:putative SOS response-associated peptidase YedK
VCGRLTLAEEAQQLADDLAAQLEAEDAALYHPRWNIAPTDMHWIVRQVGGRRRLHSARWGWQRSVKSVPGERPRERLIFNTVSETAFEKSMFRAALLSGRCLVPATGFYEWTGEPRDRRPIHFRRRDGRLLLLAGIFDESGAFTVLTTTPNAELRPVHDRMPVVLERADVDAWLEQGGVALLGPAPDGTLEGAPANPIVNRAGVDGPECLRVPADHEVGIQMALDLFSRGRK